MSDLTIGLVLPDVLGTYGDDGNALVLRQRARMRGIDAEIHRILLGEPVPEGLDVYTVGGGEDVAQILAAEHLIADGGITRAVSAGRPVLAICAGLQVFGRSFRASGRTVEGLGLIDATTSSLQKRMIGELRSTPVAPETGGTGQGTDPENTEPKNADLHELTDTLTGFANHQGATILGPDAAPLGRVIHGTGNTDAHGALHAGLTPEQAKVEVYHEGAVQGPVIATYMHGPVLARNPQLADLLLARAVGCAPSELPPMTGAFADQLSGEVARLRSERLRA
ncbi:type 1 glutamine amidotransferase [Corynebacterium provencense]|jgi:CobQ-like glutamine amidotransferase family enzyme|uniref:type 1 glutamine amidotransferase n=1 Tax=Corynebacterium provencense TaxID=1737425 RepID=UPI000833D4F0|nr:glutamine amidotransferase [Corynebacterium provencense]MCI1255506.1 glutamine amidotransferase [Corynebacterium provencense]